MGNLLLSEQKWKMNELERENKGEGVLGREAGGILALCEIKKTLQFSIKFKATYTSL